MFRKLFGVMAVMVLLSGLTAGVMAHPADQGRSHRGDKLVGSWSAQIDLFGTTLGANYSFTRDRIVIESDFPLYDPAFHASLSNGHGQWKRTGRNSFEFVYQKLGYDEAGAPIYYARTLASVETEGSTLSGTLSISTFDMDGNPIDEFPPLPITATKIDF